MLSAPKTEHILVLGVIVHSGAGYKTYLLGNNIDFFLNWKVTPGLHCSVQA